MPEVDRLRQGECWRASHLQIFPEEATPLEGVAGCSLDITAVLERCGPATQKFHRCLVSWFMPRKHPKLARRS